MDGIGMDGKGRDVLRVERGIVKKPIFKKKKGHWNCRPQKGPFAKLTGATRRGKLQTVRWMFF